MGRIPAAPLDSRVRVLCITSVIPAKAGIQRGRATGRRTWSDRESVVSEVVQSTRARESREKQNTPFPARTHRPRHQHQPRSLSSTNVRATATAPNLPTPLESKRPEVRLGKAVKRRMRLPRATSHPTPSGRSCGLVR